jgi:hypothetical protein
MKKTNQSIMTDTQSIAPTRGRFRSGIKKSLWTINLSPNTERTSSRIDSALPVKRNGHNGKR